MTPEELCAKAADLVEASTDINKDGHYYNEDTDCHCTLGALAYAFDGRHEPIYFGPSDNRSASLWRDDTFMAAVKLFAEAANLWDYTAIPDWNDRVATKEEVVRIFRTAAASRE